MDTPLPATPAGRGPLRSAAPSDNFCQPDPANAAQEHAENRIQYRKTSSVRPAQAPSSTKRGLARSEITRFTGPDSPESLPRICRSC